MTYIPCVCSVCMFRVTNLGPTMVTGRHRWSMKATTRRITIGIRSREHVYIVDGQAIQVPSLMDFFVDLFPSFM